MPGTPPSEQAKQARKPRQRIAAAATAGGWELRAQTSGSDTYVREGARVFVEYTTRGAVNYASRSRGAGIGANKRYTGAGKAEQVIAALGEPQDVVAQGPDVDKG